MNEFHLAMLIVFIGVVGAIFFAEWQNRKERDLARRPRQTPNA